MFNPGSELSSLDFGAIIGGSLNAVVKAQSQSAHTTVDFVKSVGFQPGAVDPKTGREVGVGDPICVSFSYDKEVSPGFTQTDRKVTISENEDGDKSTEFIKDGKKQIRFFIGKNEIQDVEYIEEDVSDDKKKITGLTFSAVPTGDFMVQGAKLKAVQEVEEKDGDVVKTKKIEATWTINVEETTKAVPAMFQKMNIDVPILTMMPIPFIKIEHADIEFNVKINSVSQTSTNESSNTNVSNKTDASIKGGWFHQYSASTSLSASFSNQKSSNSSEKVQKDYSLNIKVHAVQDDMPAGMSRILDILEESITTKPVSAPKSKQA